MKIPNSRSCAGYIQVSLARIVSEDSQRTLSLVRLVAKSSKDS